MEDKIFKLISKLYVNMNSKFDVRTDSMPMMSELLKDVKFNYNLFKEEDGSCTLSLEDIDIVVNGKMLKEAQYFLINDLKEYCLVYSNDLDFWSFAPNRKTHLQYILKVLVCNSDGALRKELLCLDGKNQGVSAKEKVGRCTKILVIIYRNMTNISDKTYVKLIIYKSNCHKGYIRFICCSSCFNNYFS